MFDRDIAEVVLKEISRCLVNANIPHFLIQGTALGAYRDKGFTPTEQDIDIGVLYSEFDLGNLLRELENSILSVELNTFSRQNKNGFTHTVVVKFGDIKADIVSFQKHKDSRYAQCPSDVFPQYCIVHEAKLIETWEEVEMFGRMWHVPSPIEIYLEREYGPDWRTPQEDHISRTRVYNYLETEGLC